MASLASAATGLGQGVLQNRQLQQERDRYTQQMGLQERQIGLQERGFEDEKRRADREFTRREVDRLRGLAIDPNWNKTASPAMKEKVKSALNKLYSKYPEFDYGETENAPGTPMRAPEQPPGSEQPSAPQASPIPELFGLGQQQPEKLPTDPGFGAGALEGPGPSQFDPMGIQPEMPNRPIPNTGQGVTGTAPAMPPRPAAPPTQAPGQPPTGAQVQAPPKPFSARDYWLRRATDATLSEADQQEAVAQLQNLDKTEADLRASGATAGYQEALTRQVDPNARLARAAQLEEIAMSRYKRLEYMPAELRAIIAKAKAGNGLDPSDLIALERLKFDVSKFGIEAGERASDRTFDRGQKVAEFQQREDLAGGERESRARLQAQGTLLRIIQSEVVDKNPVTGAVRVKPGGLQKAQRLIREMQGRGEQVDAGTLNPGFPEDVWGAVRQPGFNLQGALAHLRSRGNKAGAEQLKSAYAMFNKLAGATGSGVSQAPPSEKPGQATRSGYGAGGLMGPRR
jgi:hypothetical protein